MQCTEYDERSWHLLRRNANAMSPVAPPSMPTPNVLYVSRDDANVAVQYRRCLIGVVLLYWTWQRAAQQNGAPMVPRYHSIKSLLRNPARLHLFVTVYFSNSRF